MSSNPFKPGSYEHRIWQQGADATNEKWRLAIIGKLRPSIDQWFDSREVAPRPWEGGLNRDAGGECR